MSWIFFLIAPLAVATAYGLSKSGANAYWLTAIGILAIIETYLTGMPSQSWTFQQVGTSWLLLIFIPWGAVGLYMSLVDPPKRLVALGIPLVYFILLGLDLVAGDTFGLIPQ